MALLTFQSMRMGLSSRTSAFATQSSLPIRIIHVVCNGGWDQTMVLDNKLSSTSVATMNGSSLATGSGGIGYLAHSSMPNTAGFFTNHGDKTTIVNGLYTHHPIHDKALEHHLTTATPSSNFRAANQPTSYMAYYANATNPGATAPHLVIGGEIPGGAYDATSYLLTDTMIDEMGSQIPGTTELSTASETAITAYLNSHYSNSLASFPSTGLDSEKITNLALGYLREQKIRPLIAGINESVGSAGSSLERNLKIALEFFAADLSVSATILTGNRHTWDTHSDNFARQASAYEVLFAALASAITYAQSKDLASNLVFLVSSEMGRSPSLNSNNGKDHWPYSSAFLWSPLIRGGLSIGATDDYLRSVKCSLATGVADTDAGEVLTMEHIYATLFYLTQTPGDDIAAGAKIISAMVPT